MDKEDNNLKDVPSLKSEIYRLQSSIDELKILNDIATVISSSMSLERLLNHIIDKLIKHLRAEQACIMLLTTKDDKDRFTTVIRGKGSTSHDLPYKLDIQLTGWMLEHKEPLLVDDIRSDTRFDYPAEAEMQIRSLISVPLSLKGRMIGLICVFNKDKNETFSADDKRLLSIIAMQSAQVIENARLLEEEQSLKQMLQELELARQIQMNLLPTTGPEIENYEIKGLTVPARWVGGDYFDFIKLSDTNLFFCIGDISGKGMPAALLMANLQAIVHSQFAESGNLIEQMKEINSHIFLSTPQAKFCALFCGYLNLKENRIKFINAGHNYPILLTSTGDISVLRSNGLVLGIYDNYECAEDEINMNSGDILFLYSDGVSEAVNKKGEEFGTERIDEFLKKNHEESAGMILDKFMNEIDNFKGDQLQHDDITMLIIKRRNCH